MLHGELTYARIANRAVRSFPHRPAVIDGDYSATFVQHFTRVRALISRLEDMGIRRFGVLAYNGHEFLELWHAALCGPGAIAPLNFRLSAAELHTIITDSEMNALIVDDTWQELAAEASTGTSVPLLLMNEICGGDLSAVADTADGTDQTDSPTPLVRSRSRRRTESPH